MRRSLLLLVFAALSAAFAPAPLPRPVPGKDDLKKMQGQWVRASVHIGGELKYPEAESNVVSIRGDRLRYGGQGGEWVVTLVAGRGPRQADFRRVGADVGHDLFHGIYKLEGDTLTFCFVFVGEGPRPTDFGGLEPGVWLEVYRRTKR